MKYIIIPIAGYLWLSCLIIAPHYTIQYTLGILGIALGIAIALAQLVLTAFIMTQSRAIKISEEMQTVKGIKERHHMMEEYIKDRSMLDTINDTWIAKTTWWAISQIVSPKKMAEHYVANTMKALAGQL